MFRSSEGRRSDDSERSLERLSNHVHVVAERVDTLAQTLSTTAAAMAKKDGEIAVLRRELASERARVDGLAAGARSGAHADDLRELRDQVAALSRERARTSDDGRIGRLDSKVALLTERVDTLAATVANTAAGLAAREGELASVRRRVEEAARSSAPVGVDESVRRRLDDFGAAIASTSMRLESQADQIAVLRDALDAGDVGLQTDVAQLAERLEAAERERAALAASVAEAAAARWRELERALSTLSERLGAVESERVEAEARLVRTTTLWPAALRSLEAKVAELSASAQLPLARAADLAGPAATGTPARDIARFLDEIRALERRLEASEAGARHEREELLARLFRLEASRPALEPEHEHEHEHVTIGADVLPFRSTET